MKSIFEPESYYELKARINELTPKSKPHWGKMDVAQMVAHCQIPLKLALSKKKRRRIRNPIPLIFKKSLYNDTRWLKNLPTVKQARITDQRDFELEKQKLLEMVDALYNRRFQENWETHPIFGDFTVAQWGKLSYKHLDHHLIQFGV